MTYACFKHCLSPEIIHNIQFNLFQVSVKVFNNFNYMFESPHFEGLLFYKSGLYLHDGKQFQY